MEKLIYLDNAATTALKPEVLKEMLPFLEDNYSNPSSVYQFAQKARKAVEDSRSTIANILGAKDKEIYFTAGGSESDNWIIKGVAEALQDKGKHIITSKIEHHAVLHTCEFLERHGYEVTYLDVDEDGLISLDELEKAIRPDTILISVMFANNEIGTIQPIEKIAQIAKKHKIILHTDAVQACGNVFIDVQKMGIDMLSLSGHKIYGPKGIGALYVKNGIDFQKFIDGGHQEKNRRAGTENVAGIAGLGKACELAKKNLPEHIKYLSELRDYFISEVEKRISNVKLNGERTNRLPGNTNFSFQNIEGEALLLNLDQYGICASSGSACTTGSNKPSHVLVAIGLPQEVAYSSLRITFGEDNTKEEVDYLLEKLEEIVRRLRKIATGSGFKWQ